MPDVRVTVMGSFVADLAFRAPHLPAWGDFAVLGGGEKRSRCGVLRRVSLDKERDENVRIDDDAAHLRCVLCASATALNASGPCVMKLSNW